MGLNEGSNMRYLRISEGQIAMKTDETNHKAVKCTTKEGKIYYEQRWKSITAQIKHIEKRDNPFGGTDLQIVVNSDGLDYAIQMPFDGSYSTSFLKALPNADISRELTLSPWMKVIEGKKKTALYINQDGNSVEWAFTKEDPKGMPELKQVKVKGKEQWDNSDQLDFLEGEMKKKLAPVESEADEDKAPF